ncbi:MAG: hypothetical protein M1819_003620 [Sarea resinae]|nr:MAG: hypothetical protein M1819_003620 [Sarea resinae]
MAPAPARRRSSSGGSATQAEVSLVSLKNCLVNLPSSLVSILVNSNTAVQDVIVELTYRQNAPSTPTGTNGAPEIRSIFVGWTGMPSKRRLAPVVGRDGISGTRAAAAREQEIATVEVDATFGRSLDLAEGQRIGILLHLDPPLAHTIHIEPVTPADWEIIELHATFLELHLLSQIRALPNPSFNPASKEQIRTGHLLTLHLSPTSTANITVTSLVPVPPSSSPFAKIAPDAEVIVAPKTRKRPSRSDGRDARSMTSTSRKSLGGRSVTSTVRRKSARDESDGRGPLFFRGVDRCVGDEWFDESMENIGLQVWVDRDILASKSLRGASFATVSVLKPAGLQPPIDPQLVSQQGQDVSGGVGNQKKPAAKVVARLSPWDDAPDSRHVALSSALCASLSSEGMVGGIIRLETAPPQLPRNHETAVKVFPFASGTRRQSDGIKFGGGSAAERKECERKLNSIYGKTASPNGGILDGPLTDGLLLPKVEQTEQGFVWEGGIIKFDHPIPGPTEGRRDILSWLSNSEHKLSIEVQPEIPRTLNAQPTSALMPQPIPSQMPTMVGIDHLISELMTHLSHSSSVLLAGGLGSGKSSLTHLLAHRLRSEFLFNAQYFPCRKLITDETRVSTIKETLNRVFASAAWGARLGGRSVVILDDLDKLCPVETELQVGGENGRSRQVSEIICSVVRQYCSLDSGVVLLATAQGKDALNNVVIGGHVVREIISIKAPDKEGRRRVLEKLVHSDNSVALKSQPNGHEAKNTKKTEDEAAWMDGSSTGSRPGSSGSSGAFAVDHSLDFLDLAGQTDGYMPGDLVLLVSRARSEALIHYLESATDDTSSTIPIGRDDFDRAQKGFTPASLRNVTLQSSTTTFDSIGGLHATRKILLETLQYPTTYAPIFVQCPLRLRSGLLLYGYPGCGKTLLASAVAGECGLNFISVKGPEILNKYIGASEKSVRDLFERAEAARPCVLFFDEFDSIAPKRGHDSTGVTDRVVNQLLTQMDGAEGLSGVYVLAATSRPDLIDPALLRPGRLDKSIICDLPDYDDRVDILKALSKRLKISEDVLSNGNSQGGSIGELARRTEGYSGADLQAVVYNAQLEAIHDVIDDTAGGRGSENGETKGKKRADGAGKGAFDLLSKDLMQFRFGEEEDEKEAAERASQGRNHSKQLAERAAIAAKLEAIKVAKKRQRRAARGDAGGNNMDEAGTGSGGAGDTGGKRGAKGPEVMIRWKHLMASLSTTRASISPEERRRLRAIYREFVVGRNGEMPNGQGTTEVGGRTSLM